jgi:hypothetical protein
MPGAYVSDYRPACRPFGGVQGPYLLVEVKHGPKRRLTALQANFLKVGVEGTLARVDKFLKPL